MHQKFTLRSSRVFQTGLIALLLLGLAAFSGCSSSDPPPPAAYADPVSTTNGQVSGFQEDDCHIYRGIPYAAPPVGDLRWKPPQEAAPWTGVLEAIDWAPMAPQPAGDDDDLRGGIDEDCLYLNIVTPAQYKSDRFPVMVFFHGGGLATHTGNSWTYNNTALPNKGVVVVTVNSRLGPIGYMAHPALTKESGNDASGNYGTMDLVAALEWIRDNIAAFGGDPGNVTIFGESGGGTKTISVMTAPSARGLFHKAIIQSGDGAIATGGRGSILEDSEAAGVDLQEALGVTDPDLTNEEILAAMRDMTWQEIIAAGSAIGFNPRLTIDGHMLPDSVYDIFDRGEQGVIPLIVGAQSGERMLETTTPLMATMNSRTSPDTFVYVFSHLPPNWRGECVAFHGLELPYVFGHLPEGLDTAIVQYLAPGGGCIPGDTGYDEIDEFIGDYCTSMWAQFARNGNPSVQGLIEWTAYTEANDAYLEIGDPLETGELLTVRYGVADAYTPPPVIVVDDVTYTDATYGFSVTHPEDWVEGAAPAPGVEWRVGRGAYYIPSLRFIVRPTSDGATLEDVFTTHLAEDGGKTIDSFVVENNVDINGILYDKADVSYSTATYQYDSMIIGRIEGGDWYVFEVYTLPSLFGFATDTQQEDILNTVTFD